METIDNLLHKAIALNERGELTEARRLLEGVLPLAPNHAEILLLLGQICGYQSDHTAAIRHLESVRNLVPPDHLEVLFSLALAYQQVGRFHESLNTLDTLIETHPQLSILHNQRGLALRGLARDPEAKRAFEESLRINPADTGAMVNLAILLLKSCFFDQSETLLKRTLTLRPNHSTALNNLGCLYQKQGQIPLAIEHFKQVLSLDPTNKIALSNILFSMCYADGMSPEAIAAEHFSLSNRYFPWVDNHNETSSRKDDAPLRIGYVSGDFGWHPVMSFLEPILLNHDTESFQIFCYSNRSTPDATTRRLQGLKVTWREIYGSSANDVAEVMRCDGIDILVDLSGHTYGNRMDVCQLKPAPILVTWLGYPHSTGMQQFDYYISDPICDPPGMTEHYYSEKVWRLPKVFCCYIPPLEFPVISQSPHNIQGHITFGSFNNLAKVSDTVIGLWADILLCVPQSRLLLKSASLGGASTRQQILNRFAEYGISQERLLLEAHTQKSLDHLAMYAQVDIALDTYPYHGTTTTCEALWMGVPVVTLTGLTHVSRVGVSFLTAIGCPELIAETASDYVKIAATLAGDSGRLCHYREKLRAMMATSPLMNAAELTTSVELAYRQMLLRPEQDIVDDVPSIH